jgi:hypothetical protein
MLFGDDEVKVVANTKGTKGEVSAELKSDEERGDRSS